MWSLNKKGWQRRYDATENSWENGLPGPPSGKTTVTRKPQKKAEHVS